MMDLDAVKQAVEAGASAEEILRIIDGDDGVEKEAAAGESMVERFFRFIGGGNVEKAAIKRENGIDFPARDFAYVPDPNAPSTWKLRLTESPGEVTVAQLGRAAAAFSAGGFRGNRVDIPAAAISAVKRRIRAEYRKLGVPDEKIPMAVKETSGGFTLWKQKDGAYRWFAVYSNNFRDQDYPPEIISEKSHKTFIEMVDKGIVDYPELWHWHIPGTRWGKADWLDYANGFAVASGTVDEGHEKEAEALAAMTDIGVSHGMPSNFILRDDGDPSVITLHVTREISPLPLSAAANKYTGFHVFKGDDNMGFNAEKREYLTNLGIPGDKIAELENSLAKAADEVASEGVESKEADAPPATEESPVTEPVAEAPVATASPNYITREELAGVIGELMGVFSKQLADVATQVKSMNDKVASMERTEEEKIQKAASQTPTLSLAALIGLAPYSDKESKVDGRSTLAKSKPAEREAELPYVTSVPMINRLIAGADAQQAN